MATKEIFLQQNLFNNRAICSFPECPYLWQTVQEKNEEILFLKNKLEQALLENKELADKNKALEYLVNKFKQMIFGRSTEKPPKPSTDGETKDKMADRDYPDENKSHNNFKKRGARPGHKGHGRKIPDNIQVKVKIHEIPEEDNFCPHCGRPGKDINFTEDSFEVDYEIQISLIKHIRKKAYFTCNCPGKKIITAPVPAKVIPKGMYSNNFLAHIITNKYFFQIPLHRQAVMMQLQGLSINEGTLIGSFQTLRTLLLPLYNLLVEESRKASQWHVDETRWLNFVQVAGKEGNRWWLWVFASEQAIVFVLDPSRSGDVPIKHFGPDAVGIIVCDRYLRICKTGKDDSGLDPGAVLGSFPPGFH